MFPEHSWQPVPPAFAALPAEQKLRVTENVGKYNGHEVQGILPARKRVHVIGICATGALLAFIGWHCDEVADAAFRDDINRRGNSA